MQHDSAQKQNEVVEMTMKMKFWKNQNVAEAKKLAKMPEYEAFAKRLDDYRQLRDNSKYLAVYVDSSESFKGNSPFYEKIREDLGGHLDSWKESSDAIFQQEIGKTKGELAQDAVLLLEKAKIMDEKSETMVALEKTHQSQRKRGNAWLMAGGITFAASMALAGVVTYASSVAHRSGIELSQTMQILYGMSFALIPAFFACFGIGGYLRTMFSSTLQTFKDAIGIAKGEPEDKECKKSSWEFWIHG